MVRNLRPGCDWVPGIVVELLGPVSYVVQKLWKQHVDQLKELRDSPIWRSTEFEDENGWNLAEAHAEEACSDTSHPSDSPQANPNSPVTDNAMLSLE